MTAEDLAKKIMELPEERRKQPILDNDWFEIVDLCEWSQWTSIITTREVGVTWEKGGG